VRSFVLELYVFGGNLKPFVHFVIHMLHLSFYKSFWGMCIALRGQFCFVLQVICFHLWLDLSLHYKVNCLLCLSVVGFLFGFQGQLLIFYEWNYVQSILVSYLTCALRTFVILDDLSNIKCLKTQFWRRICPLILRSIVDLLWLKVYLIHFVMISHVHWGMT